MEIIKKDGGCPCKDDCCNNPDVITPYHDHDDSDDSFCTLCFTCECLNCSCSCECNL